MLSRHNSLFPRNKGRSMCTVNTTEKGPSIMTLNSSVQDKHFLRGDVALCPHCSYPHPTSANFCSCYGSILAPRSRTQVLHTETESVVASCASDTDTTVFFAQGILPRQKNLLCGVYLLVHGSGRDDESAQASHIVLEQVIHQVLHPLTRGDVDGDIQVWLVKQIQAINFFLYTDAQDSETVKAVTMTLVLLIGHTCSLVNCGYNRAYLLRHSTLRRVTDAPSSMSLTGEQEVFSLRDDAVSLSTPFTTSRCLGYAPVLQVEMVQEDVQPGESIVLCSDALTTLVSASEIERMLCTDERSTLSICTRLIETAHARGGKDAVSALVVHRTERVLV